MCCRIACDRSARSSSLAVPYDRGDVLAAIHREGEVVSSTDELGLMRVRARLSEASAGRLAASSSRPEDRDEPARAGATASSRRRTRTIDSIACSPSAERFEGGSVDLSIGTPWTRHRRR